MAQESIWTGKSGTKYKFYVYALPASFKKGVCGNYIYTKIDTSKNEWVPIYIGEGELCDRCGDDHHQADCITGKGATHFLCHVNESEQARLSEEEDLLANYLQAYHPIGCNQKIGG